MLERIINRRKAMGLNQGDFAEKAGIPDRTYSDYERGVTPIPMDRLLAIARALKCNLRDLDPEASTDETAPEKQMKDANYVTIRDLQNFKTELLKDLQGASILKSPAPKHGAITLSDEELKLIRAFRGITKKGQKVILHQIEIALRKHPVAMKAAK